MRYNKTSIFFTPRICVTGLNPFPSQTALPLLAHKHTQSSLRADDVWTIPADTDLLIFPEGVLLALASREATSLPRDCRWMPVTRG